MPPKSKSPSLSLSSFLTSSSTPKSQRSPPSAQKPPHVILYEQWQYDPRPVSLTPFMRKNIALDIHPPASKSKPKPSRTPSQKTKDAIYSSNYRAKMKSWLTSPDPAQQQAALEHKRKHSERRTKSKRTKKN